MCATNLFALRATDPKVMKLHPAPIGDENDRWIAEAAASAAVVVAAWGNHGSHLGRDQMVLNLLANRPSLMRLTLAGYPAHPLYLLKTLTPQLWPS